MRDDSILFSFIRYSDKWCRIGRKMAQIETRPRYQRYFHEIRRKIDRSLAADSEAPIAIAWGQETNQWSKIAR